MAGPGLSLSSSDMVSPESRLKDFWSLLNSTLSKERPSAEMKVMVKKKNDKLYNYNVIVVLGKTM